MKSSIHFRVALMLATISVAALANKCDICQASNGIACHSERVFSACVDGQPINDPIECPPDYICTASRFICVRREQAVAICQSITTEGPTTTTTTTEQPTTTTEEPTTTTEEPTTTDEPTTTTDEPTTTPTAPTTTTDPITTTTGIPVTIPCNRPNGSVTYFVPNADDPTCVTFIYCVRNNALVRTCPRNKYFSAELETCVEEKPLYCV